MSGPFPRELLDEIRARVPLMSLAGRHVSWHRGRSSPRKGDWWACCPFHREKTPSFHVLEFKGRYRCFGCGRGGDVFGFLQDLKGLSFVDAVAELAAEANVTLPPGKRDRSSKSGRSPVSDVRPLQSSRQDADRAAAERAEAEELARKVRGAGRIWKAGLPAVGTLVETYLRARGFAGQVPPSLRFAPELIHRPSGTELPAMLGCMQRGHDGRFAGVHRTYLAPDGSARADVQPGKMMLGQARGAVVRFAPPAHELMLAEGIETALSILQVRPTAAVWAALSLGNLKAVQFPPIVRDLTLIADNDGKDGRTGRAMVRSAVNAQAARGLTVSIVIPPRGMDFNDLLLKDAA
ncbi:MAG: CHC2 zinc finger domain-containing protein [Pseudomonadota bacterium]